MEEREKQCDSLNESSASTIHSSVPLSNANPPMGPPYHHRGSITSCGTESTESSPTTTISTFDSISVAASTDPSPSSSPESPNCNAPISPFKHMMRRPVTAGAESAFRMGYMKPQPSMSNSQVPDLSGNNSRNVKNLSLNVVTNASSTSSSASSSDASHPLSAPTSPLRLPPRTGRRKPTNLTIQTPGFDKTTFAGAGQVAVPPTPSSRPSLRHFESSPALPSLFSPTTAPVGGMQFPKPQFARLASQPGSERSSFSNQSSIGRNIDETREVDDNLKSQETTERGYTSGPVRIYDSGLYLYLEPTEDEATKFDVVINVAKEVKNPFSADSAKSKPSVMSIWRRGEQASKRLSTSEPQTALSEKSFKSAFEWPAFEKSTASTSLQASGPEYIHVPWDHNSEILDDLEPLCELIDSRINAGKSVLVHCQLGVSRSASLVIAYGLYKRYQSDFHSMYTVVKERSQWVGPNMSLIYQLMDFRARMTKQTTGLPSDHGIATEIPKTTESEKTPKAIGQTAPTTPPPVPSASRMVSAGTQTEFEPFYSMSAPGPKSNMQWTMTSQLDGQGNKQVPVLPNSDKVSAPKERNDKASKQATPRPLPFREKLLTRLPDDAQLHGQNQSQAPVPKLNTKTFIRPTHIDLGMQDVPQTPSLFSPRAAEFMAPFPRSIAGDLAFTIKTEKTPMSGLWSKHTREELTPPADPRSPHQPGHGNEIVRSIDDLI